MRLLRALPAGLSFDAATRRVSGVPAAPQELTEYALTATDAGALSAALTFRILVRADSSGGGGVDPLTFGDARVLPQSYTEGRPITRLRLPFALGGAAPIRYELLDVPPGLSFDAASRILSGVPSAAQAAKLHAYRATDATGSIATLSILIAIEENAVPSFDGAALADQSFVVGRTVALTLPAVTTGDAPFVYSLTPSLPADLVFDGSARMLSGVPMEETAPVAYVYRVVDANGDAAELSFLIEVLRTAPEDDADAEAVRPFMRGWRVALPLLVGVEADARANGGGGN